VHCTVRGTNFASRSVVTLKYEFFFFTVLNFVFCLKWTDINKLNKLQKIPFKFRVLHFRSCSPVCLSERMVAAIQKISSLQSQSDCIRKLTLRRLVSYIYIYMEHPFLMFLDHTRGTTVGRTPLDE
jgi:hypothetical protein